MKKEKTNIGKIKIIPFYTTFDEFITAYELFNKEYTKSFEGYEVITNDDPSVCVLEFKASALYRFYQDTVALAMEVAYGDIIKNYEPEFVDVEFERLKDFLWGLNESKPENKVLEDYKKIRFIIDTRSEPHRKTCDKKVKESFIAGLAGIIIEGLIEDFVAEVDALIDGAWSLHEEVLPAYKEYVSCRTEYLINPIA